MTCIQPPPLNEIELLVYLDGEADQEISAHIEECPHCRERAAKLARVQNRLSKVLFRVTCPDPVELGEYHLGLLAGERAPAVARHLEQCPHCTREVAQLESYLTELAPNVEQSPVQRIEERVQILIAQLIAGGGGTGPMSAWVPAGIRGKEAGPYIYQADDVEVSIEVQEDAENPDRRLILGLVTGLEDPSLLEVHAWRADEHITSEPADELGNFTIPDLESGTYELILSSPDVEIHIQDLDLET